MIEPSILVAGSEWKPGVPRNFEGLLAHLKGRLSSKLKNALCFALDNVLLIHTWP